MKRLPLLVLVIATVFAASASASSDPRVCSLNNQLACGKAFAISALRVHMSGDGSRRWDAQITCRGLKGLLVYVCTYRNGAGSGVARVVFAPTTYRPAVTVTAQWTCVERPVPGCPTSG